MARDDDLAPVLAELRSGGDAFGFRQGTVVTWNLITGSGSIDVGGAILNDIPFLNTGNIVYLLPGDKVILLRQGISWFILGRVTSPGLTHGVGRNTQIHLTGNDTQTNYAPTTTLTTRSVCTVSVPSWARVATVNATCQVQALNSTAATDFLRAGLVMPDTAQSSMSSPSCPASAWAVATHTLSRQVAVTPGGTLTVLGQVASTAAAWAANASNMCYVDLYVNFNSFEGD